jgi:hypothetical protein
MRTVLALGAGLAIVAVLATRAEATPIGSITTVNNLIFTLSDDGPAGDIFSADGMNDTEQFSLTLDTSKYSGMGTSSTDLFKTLALKLAPKVDAVQETSAPDAFALHSPLGGLDNGGCNGSGSGYFCTQSSTGVPLNGGMYTWTFLVDPTGAFDLPGHLKAQWFNVDGDKINQPSVDFGPPGVPTGSGVPEPTTLLLLASGLAGTLGAKYRRRASV